MDLKSLQKMLDMPAAKSVAGLVKKAAVGTSTGPVGETALKLDKWALRRGEDCLKRSSRIRAVADKLGGDNTAVANAVADFHGAAFESKPVCNDSCTDKDRHDFVAQLLETPEYIALHKRTALKATLAEIAATEYAEQFAKFKGEREEREERKKKNPDKPTRKIGERRGRLDPCEGMKEELSLAGAVADALEAATEAVEEVEEAAAACGMGPGSPGKVDPARIAAIYERVRNSSDLRRIVDLAGRFRRLAQSKQRTKVVHGNDELVGVNLDDKIPRLLPHEIAQLAIPELEDDFLRRLVEKQTLCREYKGVEKVAKGPIIVSVDESGSMRGEKAHTAKALALAMAWVARTQKRWIGLVAYSGDSGMRFLALPPGAWDEMKLLDWLEGFIGMGSSLDVPVREMPDIYKRIGAPKGKTDVLFLTDALCRIPSDIVDSFNAWKKEANAKLTTLIIDSKPGDLTLVSDEVHEVAGINVENEAVKEVVAI